MEIQCSSCRKWIDIPDEKIPQTSRFAFLCPYCRERILVDGKTDSQPAERVDTTSAEETGNEEMSVALDSIPPGTRVAFLSIDDPAWKSRAEAFFRGAGYYCVLPVSPAEARAKLRFQHHDVLVMDWGPSTEFLFRIVDGWRGLQRRDRNVLCLSDDVKSLGPDEAFVRGVNACLNRGDVERVEELLDACLKGHALQTMPWHKARKMETGDS